MVTLKVRRSSILYLFHITFLVFMYWNTFHSLAEREMVTEFLLRVIYFPVAIVYLLRISFWPYIEIKDRKLIIHRDYLMSDSFDVLRIQKIEMTSSPFKDSYFVLDNHIRYEFRYFDVEDSSFNKLIAELDKPVIDI